MSNQDKLIKTLHDQLNISIMAKKRLKYQINKDVRFQDTANQSVEELGHRYAEADLQTKSLRDKLVSFGELIDWNKQDE